MDENGQAQTRLVAREEWDEAHPRWSPDRQLLAFSSTKAASRGEIVLLEARDIAVVDPVRPEDHLAHLPSSQDGWQAEWSPDSKSLVFAAPQNPGAPWWETVYDIWKLDIVTGIRVRLTDHHLNDREPSWSPDGAHIAFATNRAEGAWEIYVMDADGRNQRPLTVQTEDRSPKWSPDGARIAFVSSRDGNFEIYVMNADGSAQTRLTHDPSRDMDPSWSPRGRILFVSDRDGDAEIFLMNADGSDLRQLTHNRDEDRWPSWRR
jgi:TolB protein